VALPTGARTVDLQFTSARYERGRLVTGAVLLVSAALVAAGAAMDRRRRAALA
jgi:hypothetical protein